MVVDQGLEPGRQDVGVNLGGRDVGVPQHLLDAPQIRAVIEEMGGEGVAQHMGRDPGRIEPG